MRLLLIEDDPGIARELRLRWSGSDWVVSYATRLDEATAAVAADSFDVILLDLELPDGDGVPWLESFRATNRRTPVLVLTARDRVADRVRGLRAGADDYLVKPYAADELDARIDVLLRRAHPDRDRVIRFGAIGVLAEEFGAWLDGQPFELAPREFEVLRLLVARAPRLLSKRALIEALSESNQEINDSAAELYISRLRKRLEGCGVEIRTMRGVGYQLVLSTPAAGGPPAPRP